MFDASLVTYINITTIRNRIYENQNLLFIIPLISHIIVVCISNIIAMASGCFNCVNVNLVNILVDKSAFIMSRGILCKMLLLGINETVFAFPLKF